MSRYDLLQEVTTFSPNILALKEKEQISEIILENPAIEEVDDRVQRFWMTDYPLLCYLQLDEDN